MSNLRITSLTLISSTEMVALFSGTLTPNLAPENITIVSGSVNVPNAIVNTVTVSGNTLSIVCQPLTPQASYTVTFASTSLRKITDVNKTAFLIEDGTQNSILVIGPADSSNIFLKNITNLLREQIYDVDNGTLVSKLIKLYATYLSKALYDLKQVKNENYLSKLIVDEEHVRGTGAFDRLNEEGAYQILRVGLRRTNTPTATTLLFNQITSAVISLKAMPVATEALSLSSIDQISTFNVNTLTLSLLQPNIIQLTALTFTYNVPLPDGTLTYSYPINKLGYRLLDSRYDPTYASSYQTLNNNQILLNDKVLGETNFKLNNIVKIQVSYQYKNIGRIVDPTSVLVFKSVPIVREVVPPLVNIFNLASAPIVDGNGNLAKIGGVSFLDPNASPALSKKHPAFNNEITFSFENLPAKIGDYAVDYNSGTVYVYGSAATNNGTGEYPPLASYTYKYIFRSQLDYVYDPDLADLAAVQTRQLLGTSASVSFNYEDTLTPGIDYNANVHQEVLSEFVQNRYLPTLSAVQTQNGPITDVFRVFNQTKGVIYNVSRWSDNKIYLNISNSEVPSVATTNGERVIFQKIFNEVLFVNAEIKNSSNTRILKILLVNNNIISSTEDCLASSFNTSLSLSNANVFTKEIYFDSTLASNVNTDRIGVGQYATNYSAGIIYVGVTAAQTYDIGTAFYKRSYIAPNNPHIVNPVSIYYRRSILQPKDKEFAYTSFSEGAVLPATFDLSDEKVLNNNNANPYLVNTSQIGAFVGGVFINGVTSNVGFIRSLYEYTDLMNNPTPINFSDSAVTLQTSVTLNSKVLASVQSVSAGPSFKVPTNLNLTYLSPNITVSFSVVRTSDSAQLWNGTGTYTLGTPVILNLPGIGSPVAGDGVTVTVTLTVNNLARVVADYNRGDYYIDYNYLADDIVLSYEYGENQIDFRQSLTVPIDTTYYVTYKAGALRSALLANFGMLIDIPLLNVFDSTLNRERYRESLIAAMSSFIDGPTIGAMKQIIKTITHVDPTIIESVFQTWSLGNSFLYPAPIHVSGNPPPAPVKGKFGNGLLIDRPDQTITMPASSNLRIEEGTFKTWITPQWNGLDNESVLTFIVKKNGSAINENSIFIGAAEFHPKYFTDVNGNSYFTTSKFDSKNPAGIPNKNKPGVFIYLASDGYGESDGYFDGYASYNRWVVDVVNNDGSTYNFIIKNSGQFFDVSQIRNMPATSKISSSNSVVYFDINGDATSGIDFIADINHYILDVGQDPTVNRLSIFKDASGYLNFKVIDKNKYVYNVSADVTNWVAGVPHFIAASWLLNSKNERDELHLFIDGVEVPNIVKYGERFPIIFGAKFRTLNPEEIVGYVNKYIVSGNDLVLTAGSASVTSAINFNAAGILPNDTIVIQGPGLSANGYTVLSVNGQSLVLGTPMPISLTSGNFSVNQLTIPIVTRVDAYTNVAVTLLHSYYTATDGVVVGGSKTLSSVSTGFLSIASIGDILRVQSAGFDKHYVLTAVLPLSVTTNEAMPSGAGLQFFLYKNNEVELPGQRALFPYYQFSQDGYSINSLILRNGAAPGDIIRIKSLGLNFVRTRQTYYQWGSSSNSLATRMPAPISLGEINITKLIVAPVSISSTNSTLAAGIFTYTASPDLISVCDVGRTLSFTVSGSNLDYATPVTVTLIGTNPGGTFTEAFVFSKNGTVNSARQYLTITSITVTGKSLDATKPYTSFSVKEAFSITSPESNGVYPVIRYSYQTRFSTSLAAATGSTTLSDTNGFFSTLDVGNYVHILAPTPSPGFYKITAVSTDHKSCTVSVPVSSTIANGTYEILNVTTYLNGLQNGSFIFEQWNQPGVAYNLAQGMYSLDYDSYISAKFDPVVGKIFIGSDLSGANQAHSVIDETVIQSILISDTRIGETTNVSTGSVTKDFNALVKNDPDKTMLTLLHYDEPVLINSAAFYINNQGIFIQSGESVNDSFNQSVVFKNRYLSIPNSGIVNTRTQGTIEFWVAPLVDTANDPNTRFYFDASGIISEKVTSINNAAVKVSGNVGQVVSVKLQHGDQSTDFFAGGTVDPDNKTIRLKQILPHQSTDLVVNYVPSGLNGDRISIYKDASGYVNFTIRASGLDYQVRTPAFWLRNTWHRIKATYKLNGGKSSDEIHLFVDGFERGNVRFGSGLLFGQGLVYGQSYVGQSNIITNITFKDVINQFNIGADYNGNNSGNCLIDNLRISNILRPGYIAFGESVDVSYNNNYNSVFPVTPDLYTTYLMDFDSLTNINNDFALVKSKNFGLFDFSVNIFDSFGIVKSSSKVRSVLEALINTLKPGNSRVFITYL